MIFNADGSIQLRMDTPENWESANPILRKGELAIVVMSDGNKLKAGDGVHRYAELDWTGGGKTEWGGIEGDIEEQTDLQNALNGKSNTGHTHDERYYTETEVNNLLSTKSNKYDVVVDLHNLNENTWYPVTGTTRSSLDGTHLFRCTNVGTGGPVGWSTHNTKNFGLNFEVIVTFSEWGWLSARAFILDDQYRYVSGSSPCSFQQMINSKTPVFFLRGGASYHLISDYACSWTIRTGTYTISEQSVSPQSSRPANDGGYLYSYVHH